MSKIRRILLGYDGTDAAREAATTSGRIAQQLGASVTVLSTGYMVVAVGSMVLPATDASAFLPIAEEGAKIVKARGVDTETEAVSFDPATVLAETAERDEYDLVVVGHRGLAGLQEIVLGSVAKKLAGTATRPVLVVRGKAPETIQKVLVPTDGSQHARRAAEVAATLASALGAHATLLHVIDSTVLMSMPLEADVQHGRQELARSGKQALAQTSDLFRQAGVDVDVLQTEGRPADVICDFARKHGIDLIAVGRRGLRSPAARSLGSVSDIVLRDGSPLVLVVGEQVK